MIFGLNSKVQSTSLYLTFSQDIITSLYTQMEDQKLHSLFDIDIPMEKVAFGVQTAPIIL